MDRFGEETEVRVGLGLRGDLGDFGDPIFVRDCRCGLEGDLGEAGEARVSGSAPGHAVS